MSASENHMKRHDLEEVIACLPRGRTLFNYGKDQYAAQLLEFRTTASVNATTGLLKVALLLMTMRTRYP